MRETFLDAFVTLSYRYQSSLLRDSCEFEGGYVMPVTADIAGHIESDKSDFPTHNIKLGELNFRLVRVGNAIEDKEPLFNVFDVTQEMHNFSVAIFDSDYEDYLPSVEKQFPDAYCYGDLLFFSRLIIEPFARGQRLGLSVLNRAMRDWSSGCSLIVLKPFPLQFESSSEASGRKSQFDNFSSSEKTALSRLRNYYQQLGFERIGRSDYYALSPAETRPTHEELDLPDSIQLSRNIIESYLTADQ